MQEIRNLYNDNELFDRWLNRVERNGIKGLEKHNSDSVVRFISDLRVGLNVSRKSKKGGRSTMRLNRLRSKLIFVLRELESRGVTDVRQVTAENVHGLFNDMKNGSLCTQRGTPYKSTGDYIKDFKVFWHWYQRVESKQGRVVGDVTEDLDARGEKPKFVYFTEEDFQRLLGKASADTKPAMALAFDSGMRVTELMNVKVSDFSKDFKELAIREEVSKTFGRKIKLMLCPDQIKEYVGMLEFSQDDFLIQKSAVMINRELRKLGSTLLTKGQTKHKNLTLYDFRHSSACFWLPRYKSESALKYRFGWKKSDMIHYYTEFLGMKDTIQEDDLYVNVTKTELEKELAALRKRVKTLEEGAKERKELDSVLDKIARMPDVMKLVDRIGTRKNGNG